MRWKYGTASRVRPLSRSTSPSELVTLSRFWLGGEPLPDDLPGRAFGGVYNPQISFRMGHNRAQVQASDDERIHLSRARSLREPTPLLGKFRRRCRGAGHAQQMIDLGLPIRLEQRQAASTDSRLVHA